MTPISTAYTRGDLIAMIHQRDGLVSDLKEVAETQKKEIERLNAGHIQPSLPFHERMQRANEAVGSKIKTINALTDLLLRWINVASNGHYGEKTEYPLRKHPLIAETISSLPSGLAGQGDGELWMEARPQCRDNDSCARHGECMYHGCPHGRASGYTAAQQCGLCGGSLPCLTHNQ